MSCNHVNDIEMDHELICREWLGEEGCDFVGIIEAKECQGDWYVACPGCGTEGKRDL